MRHFRPIDLQQMSHTRCCLAIPTPFTQASKSTIPEGSLTQSRGNLRFLKPRAARTPW